MPRSWKSFAGCLPLVLSLALAALGPCLATAAEKRRGPLRVRLPDATGMAVRRALLSAKVRLAEPGCREVLDDFPGQGRPLLSQVIESRGLTPQEHLDTLIFLDGSHRSGCRSPSVLAFTHRNGDTIWVCPSQFRRATRSDPGYAEIVLIHELLHTLGLGEDPPTSEEITARVAARCGGARERQVSLLRRASASE